MIVLHACALAQLMFAQSVDSSQVAPTYRTITITARVQPNDSGTRLTLIPINLDTDVVEATPSPSSGERTATIRLPDLAPWVVDLDAALTRADTTTVLYLRLPKVRPSAAITYFITDVASTGTSADAVHRLEAQLEGLRTGASSPEPLLSVYFKAKAIYEYWRAANRGHSTAIRSAKLWFDAAYQLAALRRSVYRMDPGATQTMLDYEQDAESGSAFAHLVRSVVPSGYTRGLMREIAALQFREVALIPVLRAEGRVREAIELNNFALTLLNRLTPEERSVVAEKQGVTLRLLQDNAAYLGSLAEGQ